VLPVLADRRAQEVAHLAPAVAEGPAREGQTGADVELPRRTREAARNAELERCDDSTPSRHASEFAEGRAGIVHVAKEVRDSEVVEGRVRERHGLGRRLHEFDPGAEPLPRSAEHLCALVDSRDAVSPAQELGCDEAGAGRGVEHVAVVARQAGDEELAPERVLPERQDGADAVVGGAERREELPGVDRRHGAYCGEMALADEIERAALSTAAHVGEADSVSGVLPTEAEPGRRVYLCSVDGADGTRGWLGVGEDGSMVTSRVEVRAAVSIAALCEVAVDSAGGGDLDALIASLADLRAREAPEGIEDAERAAEALRDVVGAPPQLATPARLDAIGAATRRLEQELDPGGASPFTAALKSAQNAVSELQREVEAGYLVDLMS
jgi:hypothetical protein